MINKLLFLLFILHSSFFIVFPQDVDKAFEYFNSGQYEKAATEFENALPEAEKKYGSNDTSNFSKKLFYTALSFDGCQQYSKAETYYLNAKKIYENKNAIECEWYLLLLNKLASLYKVTGNYEKAEPLYLQALEIIKKVLGERHQGFVTSLNNLAGLYQNMDHYEKAENLYLQALEINKNIFGEEHQNYASSLNNLATLYYAMANYKKAKTLYLHALDITKKVLGEEHPVYATSLNNLAILYEDLGNYEVAKPLILKALEIRKKTLGEEHLDYATSLNVLAGLYRANGEYEKAESMYLQAIEIFKKVLGEEHPYYAFSLNNLAQLYQDLGNYKEAELLYLQALEIRKKTLGEEHLDYAASLSSLAGFYSDIGNYQKAESLYIQGLEIMKKVLGTEHPSCAIFLNSLALLYNTLGNYEKAETFVLQALIITKKVLGEEHPNYAFFLDNLAGLYTKMGNYEKAEPLVIQGLEIKKKVFGEEHPDYATSLNILIDLYQNKGNYEKAEKLLIEVLQLIKLQNKQQLGFLSEKEMSFYISSKNYVFKVYHSFILNRKNNNPALMGESYNIELFNKRLLLHSGMQMRQNILNAGDTTIIRIYNNWQALRKSLANQYSLPIEKRTLDTKTIEEEANTLEKQLTRSSSIFAQGQQLIKTKWKDIQSELKNNETSIEFSSFHYYDGKRWTDSTYYVALVLRKNDEYPQMIYLCEEKQLDSVLNKVTGSDAQKTEQLYSARGVGINVTPQSLQLASKLYDLTWRPIDSLLKDINTVYYSPSGLLHKISFDAIAIPDSMCLLDKYKLVQLGSTAEIVGSEKEDRYITVSDTAFLCGGINYDQMKKDKGIENDKELFAYNRGPQISNDSTRSISWRYLPGTYKEAIYIDSLFKKNKISTALYSDSNATETMFKNLSGKAPQVIHVSTHGYFFPEPKKEKPNEAFIKMGEETYRFSENPLLRSGLILAGANYVWKGGEQTPGQDDGILTAYEVSNMNLYNTKLVVMSACETGLGDIKGSEGVFGLQRAFKMAGVDYIIMSLWKVPDKETTEFMKLFYSNCLSNHSIRESFYLTQTTMRKKYVPYYWAAFVLME